jgi:putative pyruvate formate lyase activating enzyme
MARSYSNIDRYVERCAAAIAEMHRQVGVLTIDENGIAQRGALIRHLVLPHDLSGTEPVLKFIADSISKESYVNIMAQYYPSYRAHEFPLLSRRITSAEYQRSLDIAENLGLHRGWTRHDNVID